MHPYRHLTLRHEQRLLTGEVPELLPGEAAFHSSYVPSLEAGKHKIKINQKVTLPDSYNGAGAKERKAEETSQEMIVIAPRYNIPDTLVSSIYPAQGDQALCKVLPHIVFNDPHFPWERRASFNAKLVDDKRNVIPWVALVAFEAKELELSEAEKKVVFKDMQGGFKPNDNFGFDVNAVESLTKLNKEIVTAAIARPEDNEKNQNTSIAIFGKDVFQKLFSKDGIGYVERYKYMSHVRKVATAGMASAIEGPVGIYSSVVSPRPGPWNTKTPSTMFVHLLSMEGIEGEDMITWKDKVAMISLYSWTYTSLPPNSWDVVTALRTIGHGLSTLKPDTIDPPSHKRSNLAVEDIIAARQADGYNLMRYRVSTGEETAAIYRGPLVPTMVQHPLYKGKAFQSNYGTDLHILDSHLSLLDITYSSAWQLGKTLAMGDQAFTAALSRLRQTIHADALERAKRDVYLKLGAFHSHDDLLHSMQGLVYGLKSLNSSLHRSMTTAVSTNRWKRSTKEHVDLSLKSAHVQSQIHQKALLAAFKVSRAPSGGNYNYHEVPNNTDYAVVQDWVLDKMHLASIPAHYFIPDPTYLPPETLRFFYVDENWTDALIDGALSLANHWADESKLDYCRSAIKTALNTFLSNPMNGLGYRQQMPKYGFLLKSQILAQFPDLTVSATFKPIGIDKVNEEKPKAPILVQRMLDTDIMLCLFDSVPNDLKSLRFTLPPHQQAFVIGTSLTDTELRVNYKPIYTNPPAQAQDRVRFEEMEYKKDDNSIFDWSLRTLKIEAFANTVWTKLDHRLGTGFKEICATSTMLALQLNDPIHMLDIAINPQSVPPDTEVVGDDTFQFSIPEYPSHLFIPPSLPPIIPRRMHPRTVITQHSRTKFLQSIPPLLSPFIKEDVPNRPSFKLEIYPIAHTRTNFIPTMREVPTDLVVSIKMSANDRKIYDWTLLRFEVEIVVADPSKPPFEPPKKGDPPYKEDPDASNPFLMSHYDMPYPATMLSNLRFNVIPSWKKPGRVIFQVIPRGKPVNTSKLADASFLIPMAGILPWKKKVSTHVWLRSYYYELIGSKREYFDDGDDFYLAPETWQDEVPTNKGDGRRHSDDWEML